MKRILAVILTVMLLSCGVLSAFAEDQAPAAAVTDQDISAAETAEAFSMTSEDGVFTSSGNVYTVSSSGTYVLKGFLEGQVVIDAGKDAEVVLELTGTTITCAWDSPIRVLSADSVDISAKKNTENVIRDTRNAKTADDAAQGEGAISANCDLKVKGSGTLVITASYNNGIHTTKDLTIQKLTLKCTAVHNALRGNDSVTVKSGKIVAISTHGDGVRTENTDVNKKGVTRGDITISGGSVTVYAAGDGFQAAHSFEMAAGEDGGEPTVLIYTGSYSGYTASDASTSSYKGVKVQNELNIKNGTITVYSYDDGLHADWGGAFEDGTAGQGTISVSGGTVTLNVYAPVGKTMGGRMGRGSWGGQQAVSGADGIHADAVLNISGGTVLIDSAYEGLEANVINISGGETRVSANDDGVNACKGNEAALIRVTGGYLDVTVSPGGDVDGIDSNGNYTQTGGVVITRGPSSQMAAAIDADGQVSVSGGTLIILGWGSVSTGGGVRSVSLSLHGAGSHTVMINGTACTFTNAYDYGRTVCLSDGTVSL